MKGNFKRMFNFYLELKNARLNLDTVFCVLDLVSFPVEVAMIVSHLPVHIHVLKSS